MKSDRLHHLYDVIDKQTNHSLDVLETLVCEAMVCSKHLEKARLCLVNIMIMSDDERVSQMAEECLAETNSP